MPLQRHTTQDERVRYAHDLPARRAVWLVFAAVLTGFLAFTFAASLGYAHIFPTTTVLGHNYLGHEFPSGNNYVSPTVSEVVSDTESAAGKSFTAFSLIAAICLLMSWYPWELSNVYIGHEKKSKVLVISWLSVRAFLPAVSMMIVALVPTTPWPLAGPTDKVTVGLHCAAAGVMFGSYIAVEFLTLATEGPHQVSIRHGGTWERTLRWITAVMCAGSMCCFVLSQALILDPESIGLCCSDNWTLPLPEDLQTIRSENATHWDLTELEWKIAKNKTLLYDTAKDTVLGIKVTSFWSEVVAGLALLANLWIIWYYCPERAITLQKPKAPSGTYAEGLRPPAADAEGASSNGSASDDEESTST